LLHVQTLEFPTTHTRRLELAMAVLDLIAPEHVAPPITHTRTEPAPRTQAVRGEYLEIPMLSLTRAQVQSFWDLDDEECDEVLDTLMACGFLKVTERGSFVRA
jgi:hypothetical protein